jgi:hypothetical protein
MDMSVTLAIIVYLTGAVISLFVVFLIKGIFFGLKLFKKSTK